MAKGRQDTLHWSLVDIEEYLNSFSPPTGDFDSAGQWEHKYILWINTRGSRSASSRHGYAKLQRSLSPKKGIIELQVEQSAVLAGRRSQLTKAKMRCKDDRLATPIWWHLESIGVDSKDKTRKSPKFEESVKVADGEIVRSGQRTRRMKISKPYTHDWAVFDAVQRLNGDKDFTIEFDMLEDFDLLRPRQRLSFHGTVDVKLGGRMTRLIGYHQIGEGILPIHYWLDEQHRLLFVVGGCRIYLFESEIK